MAHAWGTLLALCPGPVSPAYHERFGLPFWDDLDAHPDVAASFDALIGPTGHGTPQPGLPHHRRLLAAGAHRGRRRRRDRGDARGAA